MWLPRSADTVLDAVRNPIGVHAAKNAIKIRAVHISTFVIYLNPSFTMSTRIEPSEHDLHSVIQGSTGCRNADFDDRSDVRRTGSLVDIAKDFPGTPVAKAA